jgi:hypothetical protein
LSVHTGHGHCNKSGSNCKLREGMTSIPHSFLHRYLHDGSPSSAPAL